MSRLPSPIRRALRSLGPVATVPLTESGRAALGAMLGIGIAAFLASAAADGLFLRHFVLMAPFGATATLIFAAPNSPLAQPWPVFVGTLVSALVAVAVSMAVPQTVVAAPLAVALAIFVMALCRATHPPGGAVALMVPLAGPAHADPAWPFLPLALGTLLLIGIGVLFARATGRRYPFRHVGDANAVGTGDPDPVERTGLSEDELAGILVRYRQSLNLGVEDLARLIAAAEVEAAGNRIGAGTVASIMSRDLVTVAPDTPLDEIAGLFVRHGFTSLPVVDRNGLFRGVIFQLHLIARQAAAPQRRRPLAPAPDRALARDIMDATPVTAAPATPVAALLVPLAISGTDAVPILDAGRLVGIVTQTDLIAALARHVPEGR